MPIEIRKVVRQILAPVAVAVPCLVLLAAAPALAAAQSAGQSDSSGATSAAAAPQDADSPQSASTSESTSSTTTPALTLNQVVVVAPEEAVATVSPVAFTHISPAMSVVSVLNTIPGVNSQALGPMGFIPSDTAFTVDGFASNEVGTTFDGVPYINTFLGGLYGEGDDQAASPIDPLFVSGMKLYSGANTMSQSSLDDLGGTLAYLPALPTPNFGVQLGVNGGFYAGGGSETQEYFGINSGAISSLNGLDVLAKVSHTKLSGPWDNVSGEKNAFYLAAVQPTQSGEVKLIAAVTDQTSHPPPDGFPSVLIGKQYDYNYPTNVAQFTTTSRSTFVDLSVKSLLNPWMIGEAKVFYDGTSNNRTDWSNPTYANAYLGYSDDLPSTLKSCSALNAYESGSSAPGSYPETYDCAEAYSMFGGNYAGTAYQHYINNYDDEGGIGTLTLLIPDNTVTVGAMGILGSELSEESWFGSYPVPIGTTGYNMAWLEHDGQTWYNIYAEDNIALLNDRLHIYPGFKYNSLDMYSNDDQGYYYDYSGSVEETYKWVERSIGVNYALTHELNAYINYGQSTKPPDVSALYGNIGASPQPVAPTVKPEYVNNIDAGIRFKNAYYNWDVAFFNRDFNNIFSETYSSSTGITLTHNAGKALFRGFTLNGGVNLPYNLEFRGNFGYTNAKYTESFTNVNGSTITDGMWRPNIPEETANLELDWTYGPWFAKLDEHYIGSQYIQDYNDGETTPYQLGGYGTLNFDGDYNWVLDNKTLQSVGVELHVDNILDRHAIAFSPGAQLNTPGKLSDGVEFIWDSYNTPMFVSLELTANLF
ncbi:MAG TPA: TonB-dependent receptor [Steroidobacteraceae bacterium]|jgi:outer membrane receptor protein involved in Fe transport|nr:TonB-dependent receptor [Steroidobacteraceae bacterium]